MTPRTCRYGCGILLEGWDDNARKYIEAGTGGLHTRERCQEAKLKLELKNDHGNELSQNSTPIPEVKEYVDHTMAGIPQIITIVGDSPEEMDDFANSWLKKEAGRIRFKGGQRAVRNKDDRHEITLYYEEIGKQ